MNKKKCENCHLEILGDPEHMLTPSPDRGPYYFCTTKCLWEAIKKNEQKEK